MDRCAQAKRRLKQLRAELGEVVRAMPEAALVARSAVRHAEVARAEAHLRHLQEQALEVSNNRIQDLEDQLRAMQGAEEPRGSRSGSFLGGAWTGGRRDEPPRSSVPYGPAPAG